jgi:hypothetical protein
VIIDIGESFRESFSVGLTLIWFGAIHSKVIVESSLFADSELKQSLALSVVSNMFESVLVVAHPMRGTSTALYAHRI